MTDSGSDDNSQLLSVTQTARLLNVTRQRVHDLIKNGQIGACKLGRYYYIGLAD
ncbi:MAG: helix-turn-helix domain-containing protein [Nostochopsis sp.]